MNEIPTLQELEYMETGYEVSKILTHAGFTMDQAAVSVSWGQIAEEIAHTLADYGLPLDRLENEDLIDLVLFLQKVLQNEDMLCWRSAIRTLSPEHPLLSGFLSTINSDEDILQTGN